MKLKPFVDKLHNSSEYKEFQQQYKDAYMAAGFFVLDLEAGKNIHQIDYYIPAEKKVAAFTIDHGITMQKLSLINSKIPEKLDLITKVDLDALKGILEDEMKNRSITEEIKKIIAVIQKIEGKTLWNLNCVLSGMGILRAHVDDESRTVLKMEKASILDYIKRISPQDMQKMSQQAPQPEAPGAPEAKEQDSTKEKLKKLEALEAAIAKEKKALLEQEKKKEKK
ncbi:hypothetical protein HYZ97_05055 [Candidatus Pacearchaeota archaeon]|nr:hypothetical protein [Candidatus Pacearchaeota archaeon]